MPQETRGHESNRSVAARLARKAGGRIRTLSQRPNRPQNIQRERKVGDLFYPACTIIPLDWKRTFYAEDDIKNFLRSLDYGPWIEEIHDCEDRALLGMVSIRNLQRFYGAPVGIAIGSREADGAEHAVVIYWTDAKTRKYWDPDSRDNVIFHPDIVVA